LIEALKDRLSTQLTALIIVPTRELVVQVKEVVDLCSTGTGIKIGAAVGNQILHIEQSHLVKRINRYDPKGYTKLQESAQQVFQSGDFANHKPLEACLSVLPDHTHELHSQIDILICTPGRLVEHINFTEGFTLHHLRWIIIDEADRLLDESFQEWADVLTVALKEPKSTESYSARGSVMNSLVYPKESRNIQKIILSATMTNDVAKLASLNLKWPKLVVVENIASTRTSQPSERGLSPNNTAVNFDLPSTLREKAMPVGDGSEKALFLVHLLRTKIFRSALDDSGKAGAFLESKPVSDAVDNSAEGSKDLLLLDKSECNNRGQRNETNDISADPKVLIFVKDSENASRLSLLIGLLHHPYADKTAALTKSSATAAGRKALGAFRTGQTSILISSDRAARGIDIPNLSHVINYDLPRNITAYVHRVGRTARAGRSGEAWTLFTKAEGKWFWKAIAQAPEVKRGDRKVQRIKPPSDDVGETMRLSYQEALKHLQEAVHRRVALHK
jgi:ATP-dependent RNA helicase DDX51/DBP6